MASPPTRPRPPPPLGSPPSPYCCRALSALRPLDRPERLYGPACGDDALSIRRGECRSHPRTPPQGMGPWRQRRRSGRRNALVSSLAARRHGETPGSVCPGPMPQSQARACGPGHTRRCRHLTPWRRRRGGGGGREGGSCVMWLVEQLFGLPGLYTF
jgi:hypothetical protein